METFKERIEKIMAAKELNPNKLATLLGTSSVNIYRYLNGGAEQPSVGMLNKFEKIGINKNWLIDGKGEMFLDSTPKTEPVNDSSYLLDVLKKIEESFKSDIAEKDRVIADQRFIIDTLKNQVAALSSVNAGLLDPNTGEPKMNILDGDFEFEDLIRA